ncbi:hypothetical protein [Bradyrhizobium erythrophlei]|uniref:Uncharacterized protein n=1 Tax=Bradyrhizobium erythrophlei TaxID=1437360 RepID=A0A1M7TEF8_9BRAD|nr:hypothetical protein [Bradyrhizobium erythrophlei]SHN69154.1 hypothetical protein SAMN05444170_1504 [Bradyrhizobium erythrophlei]
MSSELEKRMEKLERLLNAERPAGMIGGEFLAVLVYGGLTPLPVVASDDTGREWIRAAGESVEDFAQRAASESRAAGARLCTIGGMGSGTPSQNEALSAAWDEYLLTGYPDVPPVTHPGPARSQLAD